METGMAYAASVIPATASNFSHSPRYWGSHCAGGKCERHDITESIAAISAAARIAAHSIGQGFASQISAAYWLMVRSLENLPELATFRIALCDQPTLLAYNSTSC